MRRLTWSGVAVVGFAALAAALGRPAFSQEAAAQAEAQSAPAQAAPAAPDRVSEELEERYRRMADELKQELPERDIKVQAVDPQKVALLRADPKLFENKFVAQLMLSPALTEPADENALATVTARLRLDMQSLNQYPKGLGGLLHVNNAFLLHPSLEYSSYPDDRPDPVSFSEHFQRLAGSCSPDALPAKEFLDFLTAADSDRDVRYGYEWIGKVPLRSIAVFAPTTDEAEQRAKAIVRLYDGGLSRPMQRYLLGEGEKLLEQARTAHRDAKALAPAIEAAQAKLAKPSDISPDVLTQLKAQKVLVAVELAGLSARVKACDAKLSDPEKLGISTLQSISDLKVTAEIERVGMKEKLDQINAFIAEGDERHAARVRQVELGSNRSVLQATANSLQRDAIPYADLFALYAPFRIAENQITVGPIEWANE